MRAPTGYDEELSAYLFLFEYKVGGGQIRYFQRSIVLAPITLSLLENRLSDVVQQAHGAPSATDRTSSMQSVVKDPEEGHGDFSLPLDATIYAPKAQFQLCVRSPSTGQLHKDWGERTYCPVTGKKVSPFVVSSHQADF